MRALVKRGLLAHRQQLACCLLGCRGLESSRSWAEPQPAASLAAQEFAQQVRTMPTYVWDQPEGRTALRRRRRRHCRRSCRQPSSLLRPASLLDPLWCSFCGWLPVPATQYPKINVKINGRDVEVPDGASILQACSQAGAYVSATPAACPPLQAAAVQQEMQLPADQAAAAAALS